MNKNIRLFILIAMLMSGCSSTNSTVPSKSDAHRFANVHFMPALDGNIDYRFCDHCQAVTEKTIATAEDAKPLASTENLIPNLGDPASQVVAATTVDATPMVAAKPAVEPTVLPETSGKADEKSAPLPETLLPPVAVDPPAIVSVSAVPAIPEKTEEVAIAAAPVPRKTIVVYFSHNSSRLDAAAVSTLNAVVKELAGRNDISEIEAHGYTDNLGNQNDPSFNQKLSMARAQAVSDFIHAGGGKAKVLSFAEGDCCFVTDNASDEARALNRRVEIIY